jgi:hypothetical protein
MIYARRRKTVRIVRQFLYDYIKSHPCVDWKETDPVVLEFDHVRGEKRYNLGKMSTTGFSLKKSKKK